MSRPRTPVLLGAAALGATLAVAAALPAAALPAAAADGPEKSVSGGTTTIKVLEKETGGQFIPKPGSTERERSAGGCSGSEHENALAWQQNRAC